jgi:hypothetical protein
VRISPAKQFILLHVPRTGGGSVIAALDEQLFVRAPPTMLNKLISKRLFFVARTPANTYFRAHETAAHLRRLLPAATFEKYCKIAFVRNPYSWLVSLYELVVQSPKHRHYDTVSSMRGFGDYVDWEIGRNKRLLSGYLCDKRGRLLVDRIGRFESLADDAARIFASLNVDLKPLPRIGQRTRQDYREFYDAASRRKVASHWGPDLDLFGYDFDGPIQKSTGLPGCRLEPAGSYNGEAGY